MSQNFEGVHTNLEIAAATVDYLGGFAAWYSRIDRATVHDDGLKENDAEHSYMLGLVAPYLAQEFYPELDLGLISQFATVHDMCEAVTGDVPTFNISDTDMRQKESDESEALKILVDELPQYWADMLQRYVEQTEAEARFVRVVDKLMPALMHIHGDGKAMYVDRYGMTTGDEVRQGRRPKDERLLAEYPEYEDIIEIRIILSELSIKTMFDE